MKIRLYEVFRSFGVGNLIALLLTVPCVAQGRASSTSQDLTGSVDPFIGVDWGGNTFVGAAVPFGTVKVGPDMESFDGKASGFGYISGGRVVGFSQLHLSGASGKYGNILVTPVTGDVDPGNMKSARTDEVNHPGYYAAKLTRYGIKAELTSTRRVGVHRYTFPASNESHVTVDIQHCLSKGPGYEGQRFLGGQLKRLSDHEAEGVGRYEGGWNNGGEYDVYFYIVLDTPALAVRTWTGSGITTAGEAGGGKSEPLGVIFDYRTRFNQVIQAKVGISFISSEQARQNVGQEVPGWGFDSVRSSSVAAWNRELAKIQLRGESESKKVQFYTAMYHTMLMPSDRTGENPGWQSKEPYYDDYYAIWDTYRSSGPLLTLIAADRQRDLIRSLIDIYRHTGYMPDARSGNDNGRTQGGSNANVVIADAYVKGLTGIDYATAFEAMLKDASAPPKDGQREGRGGIIDYNNKGYVTLADERSGSRTVEYAYDDFAIAEVACGLNHPDEAKLFAGRSHNWENLWDKDLTREGFQGFLRPRNPDGSWAEPNFLVRGTWPDFFYEGDLWTYSFYAPHDVRKLMELSGGKDAFVRRLDNIFYRQHFDVTNEPGFLIPVLYNWAGRPDKTAEIVNALLEKAFTDQRSGIPGNDDSGAMSSWFIFHSLGFYPNAGQALYLIGTPSFPEVEMRLSNGKVLRIEAHNLDAGHTNHYIQSATLNGAPLDTSWFRHEQIANGGTLVFMMGSEPTKWGTAELPPSLSDTPAPFCATRPH